MKVMMYMLLSFINAIFISIFTDDEPLPPQYGESKAPVIPNICKGTPDPSLQLWSEGIAIKQMWI